MNLFNKIKYFKYNKEDNNLAKVARNIIYIILIVSLIANLLSVRYLQSVVIEVTTNIANILDSSIKELIVFAKDISSDYSGLLGFLGSFLGGSIAIWVFRLQRKSDEKQGKKRLMFLLLSTYKQISIFEINGYLKQLRDNEFLNIPQNANSYKGLVYDEEWRKLIIYISNYNDTEFLTTWFFNIEQLIIVDKEQMEENLDRIREILIKNKFGKYLDEIETEIDNIYLQIKANEIIIN